MDITSLMEMKTLKAISKDLIVGSWEIVGLHVQRVELIYFCAPRLGKPMRRVEVYTVVVRCTKW